MTLCQRFPLFMIKYTKITNGTKLITCTRHTTARLFSKGGESSPQQCMEIVRKFDYENFLSTLLLPKNARATSFAVRAFNIELAQIRDIVSDRTIGRMRVQFWRESIENIFKNRPPHTPVAFELSRVIHENGLSKIWFTRIMDAREQNLTDNPFPSLPKVEEHAENCVSSILYLILESLGVKDVKVDHVASHIGKAVGITTMLRGLPFNAQRGRCYLPTDLMILHNVSQEDIIRASVNQGLKDLIYDVASQAHIHLRHARDMKTDVPKAAVPAFYCTVATESYLKSLQRADFNVFDDRLKQRNSWLPLLLLLNQWRRRY